jgi:hypothetical protein
MLQAILAKKIASVVLEKVMEKRAMKKIRKYVDEPNDADNRIDELELKVAKLEKFSHAQADFLCMDCGCKAKRVTKKKNKRRK